MLLFPTMLKHRNVDIFAYKFSIHIIRLKLNNLRYVELSYELTLSSYSIEKYFQKLKVLY